MYSCLDKKNILINPVIFVFKIGLTSIKLYPLKLILLFFLFFIFVLNLSFNYNSIYVYGHSLFGNNNGSGIQIQTNGNYKVELSTSPSKLLLNKSTDILLRVTSTTGEELMEVPAYLFLAKDGKIDNNSSHTLVMIRGGHYNFKSIFPEKGKYLLFVEIKDIYYTGTLLNFIFELNVDVPIIDQFYDMIKSFFINYYYIYIPIAAVLISIITIKYHKKNKIQGKLIIIVRELYKKLHK